MMKLKDEGIYLMMQFYTTQQVPHIVLHIPRTKEQHIWIYIMPLTKCWELHEIFVRKTQR